MLTGLSDITGGFTNDSDPAELFTGEKLAFYIGGSDELAVIKTSLPGYYAVSQLPGMGNITGSFTNIWSISGKYGKQAGDGYAVLYDVMLYGGNENDAKEYIEGLIDGYKG